MAQFLRDHGYTAYALEGGLRGWLEADLPAEPKIREQGRTIQEVCPGCGRPAAGHAVARA